MKLTQLEYFCVAARYHNITKIARELFVTQPSISNATHQSSGRRIWGKSFLKQFF